MSRAPVAAFVALVIATIGAFFVTQHLKVTTPLIAGFPSPAPSTINPVNGGVCPVRNNLGVAVLTSFKRMKISFYLLNRADNVDVYVVQHGQIIDTLRGSGRHMKVRERGRPFIWNGRTDDGAIAPDGAYDIKVSLVHQGRSLIISNQATGAIEPVTVQTAQPDLRVTGVEPAAIQGGSRVVIHFAGNDGLRPRVWIYRLAPGGGATPVKSYSATTETGTSVWNGTIRGLPAPPGRYLIGLKLTSRTCNQLRYPAALSARAAPQAVVTVS